MPNLVPPVVDLPEVSFRVEQTPARGRRRGAVILLPELWGIVPQIRGLAARFAAEGFAVYIPDLLPGTIEPTAEREAVMARYRDADDALAMKEIARVVALVRDAVDGPLVAVGFCYGGRMALHAAAHVAGLDGAVSFYGTLGMPSGKQALDPRRSLLDARIPVQAHYGDEDASIPPADVAAVRQGLRRGQVFTYAGAGHAFMNETRESYRPAQAAVAWGRVLDFLRSLEDTCKLGRAPEKEPWELELS